MISYARHRLVFSLLGLLLASSASFAHGDLEKPLYVATNGVDGGSCFDAGKPCRTIGYALTLAGKGGQIRVAEGNYEVASAEDLFHILSGVIDIEGGLQQADGFSRGGISRLIGVPVAYREPLQAKGFQVITDRKGIDGPAAAEAERLLALHQELKTGASAAPCIGGTAAGLECASVDLLSHTPLSEISGGATSASDVWGFLDLNTNREYALVGLETGTAVMDVTNPEAPFEVGVAVGTMATWRDMKVHQFFDAAADRWRAYAYVTTDGSNDGMIVVDLTELPNRVSRSGYRSDFTAAHNVYITNTDFGSGLQQADSPPMLIVAGSNIGAGQYRAYSLLDPGAPAHVPAVTPQDYMHDAASMVITDERKDTQCVNGSGHCEILFDFNETTVDIWDITAAGDARRLSRTAFANRGYVHSGWWSEDKRYLFVQDELDERNFGLPTTLRIFSLDDLRAPVLAATWSGSTGSIDHNGFVRGNRYYMSNYSRGLTVIDISDPRQPAEVGFLDTYPFSQSANFVGAWGTYPFFPSGTVAVSDIDSGIYLVDDRTRSVAAGTLGFSRQSYGGVEGSRVLLPVERTGGTIGEISVDYEILAGSADPGDFQVISGRLTWTDGELATKAIEVDITDDGIGEVLERVLVRLSAPEGGASLGTPGMASLYIEDAGAAPGIRLLDTAIEGAERGPAVTVIAVQRVGSASGQVSVDYSVTGGDASAGTDFSGDTSGTVVWPDGDGDPQTLMLSIIDDSDAESEEFFELSLANPLGAVLVGDATVRVTIRDNDGAEPPPEPPPAPPARRSGGGAPGPMLLLLLGVASVRRLSRTGFA